MMKAKRIASLVLALVLLCTTMLSVSAKAGTALDWTQFRGSVMGAGTTDSKIPTDPSQVEEKWAVKLGTGWTASMGTPIIVGEYVYVYGNGNLNRIDRESGELLKTVPCEGTSQFFSQIAYGDGKIFVPRSVNRTIDGKSRSCTVVYAYDEETMEPLWVSDTLGNPEDLLQPLSAITYHQGYLYMGVSNGKADKGAFVCLSAKDEQPNVTDEIKQPTWTYFAESGKGGYYWSAGAVVGNVIVFGGENGVLVSHSLTENRVIDTAVLEENSETGIRSTVAYDAQSGRVFVSSKTGKLHSIKVNDNGVFDEASLQSIQLDRDITSSPVVYNGRVYQGGGGIESQAGFAVLDAETLDVIYTIPEIQTQASPILTTAYATAENGNTVYLYVTKYSGYESGGYAPNSACTYVIEDKEGQTNPSYQELVTPSQLQYCTQSLAVAEDGSFCYYNDSAKLFYFGYRNQEDGKYTAEDVVRAIDRLPSADQITLSHENDVDRVQERYERLTQAQKEEVSNVAVLTAAADQIAQLKEETAKIAELIRSIDGLHPDLLTVEDYASVMGLQAKYQSLSTAGKIQVTNAPVLEQAVKIVTDLKDCQEADNISKEIAALPEIELLTKNDQQAVNDVHNRYQSMSDGAQKAVSEENREKLLSAKQRVDFLVSEINAINLAIWKLPVDQISVADDQAVTDIMNRYAALGVRNQEAITGYSDVLYARRVIDGLKENRIVAEVFERIKGQDKTYSFTGTNDKGAYTISFAGTGIVDSTLDFDAGITFVSKFQQQISAIADQPFVFAMQQGTFPGTASVTLPTGLPDGTYQLYRYLDEAGKAERMQAVTVTNGQAELQLAQGGTYFLAEGLKSGGAGGTGGSSSVQTGDPSAAFAVSGLVLAAGSIVVLWKRKK